MRAPILPRVLAIALAVLAANAFAAPPAGTVIGNQATATYNDAGGVARTATSNLVQTTVSQVKSFTLTANGARTAAPGQTVYYPHTITNAGNGTDTYTLDAPASSNFAAAAAPHGSLAYYADANGDGVPDNATPIVSSGPIAAGGIFRFVVAGTVPATAASGNTATITVSVTDTNPSTLTNLDTTTVANSVIGVTKALSAGSGPSPAGPLTVTLTYANTGTAAANAVQLTDIVQAGFTYVPGSGRWSVSGATALTDANDGVEATGIDYRFVAGTVTATIPTVASGLAGTLTFQVNVAPNLAPQVINNTAQYQTATQLPASTNTASYTVLQAAAVVANGSNTIATNGTGEPVTLASGAAGATVTFNDYVWNRGNGTDTFDIAIAASTFPAGSSITLLQHDGATTLVNSAGAASPDTGPIPGAGQPCPAPLVTDGTFCGYRVVVRVTLPASAAGGPFSATLRATSVFNTAVSDDVVDTLLAVTPNTVDVTNDRAAPPAGTANAADGLGASGAAIVRTLAVVPGGAPTVSRFQVWVTNTGALADTYNLTATPVAPLPAGWIVEFRADGGVGNCTTVGAAAVATGVINPGAARLFCAQVTTPTLASGNAGPGNYDFDFAATSQTNASVNDVKRDRIAIGALRAFTLVPNGAQQTFPGGTVTYAHTLTNTGNGNDTASFAAACLADSRAAQGWTSSVFVDANANGTFEAGTDTAAACGAGGVTLNAGESRAIFVRVTAPAGASAVDPANVTTLTLTFGAASVAASDSTTVTQGLAIAKEQQALGTAGCAANPPAAGYSAAPAGPNANTVPGACIAYRITVTNAAAAAIGAIVINDIVPANTRMHYACSGNGLATPNVTVGAMAGTTPANAATGTITANVGALAPAQSAVLYFCVRIDP